MNPIDPLSMLRPRRKIAGISAILLPFLDDGSIDWSSFERHVTRTAEAGLTPAVNMDTGYVNLLTDEQRAAVLERTRGVLGGRPFVAGAFVNDRPGDRFQGDGYKRQIELIQKHGGTPTIFPSFGLCGQDGEDIVRAYRELAKDCERFIGFELTKELAAFGAIYDLETYAALMEIPQCIGAKHSSFRREPEWARLRLRDAKRPDFIVYTGNDFAIDMVMYGSDYLLGLSTFAPDLFAQRDAYWEQGDPAFYELNDILQYLGMFAFRRPGPGYKHNAAQFLKLRGWITTDRTHPQSVERPGSDVAVLREIGERLGVL
jgi:dihydrodipicolinate synthase/N-acetylneuraminate lyase